MKRNNVEFNILIKGKSISEYEHNGDVYVEGRDGSKFELEIRNYNNYRIEAILSVDGLSVIDGKDAGPNSSGYMVDANSTIRIPGWKVSDEVVAAFTFTGKKNSYAAQSTGSSRNNGVIGAMIYAEKPKPQAANFKSFAGFPGLISSQLQMSVTPMFNSYAASSVPIGRAVATATSGFNSAEALSPFDTPRYYSGNQEVKTSGGVIQAEVNNIGTAFGEATDFSTTEVPFERGDLLALMVTFYDDLTGLRARGVKLERRKKAQYDAQPQAFPAANCRPPKGWSGRGARKSV